MLEIRSSAMAALLPLFALQADDSGVPWWVWLIIILIVLLILFIAFVAGQKPGPSIPEGGVRPEPMAEQPVARQAEVAMPDETEAAAVEPEPAAPKPAAIAAMKPDDLKIIEGIGPKVSRLLRDSGIRTFAELAAADVGRLNDILQQASLPMINPASWPEQAKLAAAGDMGALQKLQDELKGGRRT